ncbi:hypothetical protein [Rhodococcus sp. NPDC003348]
MSTTLRPGEQLASTTCTTRVVVVRAPSDGAAEIGCGGAPMVAATGGRPAGGPVKDAVTVLGKRYVNEGESVELLCTVPGVGELTCDGVVMTVKAARALPASD